MTNKTFVTIRIHNDEEKDWGWQPINFHIDSDFYNDLVTDAVDEWSIDVEPGLYELILNHVREIDRAGALTDEHFEVVYYDQVFDLVGEPNEEDGLFDLKKVPA